MTTHKEIARAKRAAKLAVKGGTLAAVKECYTATFDLEYSRTRQQEVYLYGTDENGWAKWVVTSFQNGEWVEGFADLNPYGGHGYRQAHRVTL